MDDLRIKAMEYALAARANADQDVVELAERIYGFLSGPSYACLPDAEAPVANDKLKLLMRSPSPPPLPDIPSTEYRTTGKVSMANVFPNCELSVGPDPIVEQVKQDAELSEVRDRYLKSLGLIGPNVKACLDGHDRDCNVLTSLSGLCDCSFRDVIDDDAKTRLVRRAEQKEFSE